MFKKIFSASRQPMVALRLDSVTMGPVGNGSHYAPTVVLHLRPLP